MNIVHSIVIKTTPKKLYDAITTKMGIEGWWAPKTKAVPKEGTVNEMSFGPGFLLSFRVDTLEPERRVVWSSVQVPPDWKGTKLTFALVQDGDGVEFTFTHSGLPAAYADYGFFNYCWGQYVRSLKLLLETGTGEPFGSAAANAWHPLNG